MSDIERAALLRYRRAAGTPDEDTAYEHWRRVARERAAARVVARGGSARGVDQREEWLALGEHLALR